MSRYAEQTTVSPEKSRYDIERILQRYGADSFHYSWSGDLAVIGFRLRNRVVRFEITMPSQSDPQFWQTPTGRERSESAATKEWEQAYRQRWRALTLLVKAKLEAVEGGIVTFEEEFLPFIVLPDGNTVSQHVMPKIEKAYNDYKDVKLLPEW